MKIAIIGTRGVPNNYGGFEQVTEFLSVGLLAKGHEVFVYNSHNHPHKEKTWNGVQLIHCYDPEYLIKTAGQFIYDFNCIRDARKRDFDVLLFMGYSSSSIWHFLFPKKQVIVTNMDGLEWKRTKYSKPVQKFLRYAEKLAVRHSDFHIVDSSEIQDYYKGKYGVHCAYIPYGASLVREEKAEALQEYNVTSGQYYFLMARMEPENNIEMILEGFHHSGSEKKFIVVGNIKNDYGKYIARKYSEDPRIHFAGSVFNQDTVHTLRKYAALYFHGHSVGGTNPSLLEAMASKAMIAAHENPFNKAILVDNAFYFSTAADIQKLVEETDIECRNVWRENNFNRVSDHFYWQKIIDLYDAFLRDSYKKVKDDLLYKKAYAYE
jgi:glycosyltransferase involved in cell wall biosynthesis